VASAGPDAAFQVIVHVIVRGEVEVTLQSILILDGGPSGDFIIWSSFVLTCCARVFLRMVDPTKVKPHLAFIVLMPD
jgi:hypothetical protein